MMGIPLKCLVSVLVVGLVVMWSMMFYYFGVNSVEGPLQTGAVERGYAEWVLPESPYREYPGWRWIGPEDKQ